MAPRVHENDIRDKLAQRLHLIEPGLRLVATEFAVPSRHGAGGRIDILARDVAGALVVVELKRTGDAAERALHELAKYVELLQQERGLGADRLRVVVAAVEWRGLYTPFSQIAREWTVDVRGYRIVLADDGSTPLALQRIEPLPAGGLGGLTPNQLLIQPADGDIDAVWKWATRNLAAVGTHNVVGFDVVHTTYPAGLYLVIGRHASSEPHNPQSPMASTTLDEEEMSGAPPGYETEYLALCRLCEVSNPYSIEAARPDSLAAILSDSAWTVRATRRAGVYEESELYPQDELLAEASTGGGLSDIKYTAVANVEHHQRWRRCVSSVDFALGGNVAWAAICRSWLDEVEAQDPRADVFAHVYNPCDFVAAIVHGWPSTFHRYVPLLIAAIVRPPAAPRRELRGGLFWDGTQSDVLGAFDLAYRDVHGWLAHRVYGTTWEPDLFFLELLGLRYGVIERIDGAEPGCALLWGDGSLIRVPPSEYPTHTLGQVLPLAAWAETHRAQLTTLAVQCGGTGRS